MKRIKGGLFVTGLLLLLAGCARMRYAPAAGDPIIRVGILEDQETIYFEPQNEFSVVAYDARENFQALEKGLWKATVHSLVPHALKFHIQLYESLERDRAEEQAARFRGKGLAVTIKSQGEQLQSGGKMLIDRLYHRVILDKDFDSSEEADLYLKSRSTLAQGRVVRSMEDVAMGKIALHSPSGRTTIITQALRLTGTNVVLRDVEVGSGYHWARNEARTYGGEMELRISAKGRLTAINVVPLELYLRGVVAGEMANSFPDEALKAQAIISRTMFLNSFGRFHRGAEFDVCDDVHCQAYVGMSHNSDPVDKAVHDTKGLVLTYQDALCTASYSAMCGGHTASAAEVWDGDGEPYLTGRLDTRTDIGQLDLTREENARLWISSRPDVCCNLSEAGHPDFGKYAEKYFRWEQRIPRVDLEKSIAEYAGTSIGKLVDIVPVQRGVSGGLISITCVGTEESVQVRKELNIRRALSKSTLYSSCFIVEKEEIRNGLAETFVFKGAGWGHGVGLCQLGAAVRAQKGDSVSEILSYYYPGTQIKQLY
jgi:SpoIID/LytB domain protein